MIREVAFVGSDLFSGELLAFAFGGCDLIRGNYWPLVVVTFSERKYWPLLGETLSEGTIVLW